ncbi:hypothetical protein RDABS01_022443 [Bienertia sinuspersici]
MADEIVKGCAKLSIINEEDDVSNLGAIDDSSSKDQIALSLVGNILTVRAFNFEAMQRTLKQEIEGDEQPETMVINSCPFWIRLYNLPLDCRTNAGVEVIASKVGRVLEVENNNLGRDRSRRVCIMLNMMQPLRHVQKIRDKRGAIRTVDIKYERLPLFCCSSRCIGHVDKDCTHEEVEGGKEKKVWGVWLRASPRKGRMKMREEEDHSEKGKESAGEETRVVVLESKALPEVLGEVITPVSPHSEESVAAKDNIREEVSETKRGDGEVAQLWIPTFIVVHLTGKEGLELGKRGTDDAMEVDGEEKMKKRVVVVVATVGVGPLVEFVNSANEVFIHCPSLLFLAETMVFKEVVEGLKGKLGFHGAFGVSSEGLSGGLCCFGVKNRNEKEGGPNGVRRDIDGFRNVMDDCSLRDLGYIRSYVTWERGKSAKTRVRQREAWAGSLENEVTRRVAVVARKLGYGVVESELERIFSEYYGMLFETSMATQEAI